MIKYAEAIEEAIVARLQERMAGVFIESNPEALSADDYESKSANGFILVTYLLSPKFDRGLNYIDVTMQFLIAFGAKNFSGNEGVRKRLSDAYEAVRGMQVDPMRSELTPVALRPLGKNENDIWRGDLIVQCVVRDKYK